MGESERLAQGFMTNEQLSSNSNQVCLTPHNISECHLCGTTSIGGPQLLMAGCVIGEGNSGSLNFLDNEN